MRKINDKLKAEIDSDPYYKISCLSGRPAEYGDRIVMHHAIIYGGVQLDEKWAIVPLLESEHSPYSQSKSVHNSAEIKRQVEIISILRMTEADKKKYLKRNWEQELKRLGKEVIT